MSEIFFSDRGGDWKTLIKSGLTTGAIMLAKIHRTVVVTLSLGWVMAAFFAGPAYAQKSKTGQSCTFHEPVLVVTATKWYSDAAGSEVDEEAFQVSLDQIRPLREYATDLNKSLDKGEFGCAEANLQKWAEQRALLQKPANFAAMRERMRFAMAITLAALRLKADDRPLAQVVKEWLTELNVAAAADFQKRNIIDNLYVWAGATAAIGNLVSRDDRLEAFAGAVWKAGVAQIAKDGTLPSELRRKSRSLLYHVYYLTGLAMLNSSLSRSTQEDEESMRWLYERARKATCDPETFAVENNIPFTLLPPSAGDLATIVTFTEGKRRSFCGQYLNRMYDPLRGGRLPKIRDDIEKMRNR